MTPSRELAHHFEAYTDWRRRLSSAISRFRAALAERELIDGEIERRVAQLTARLSEDKLVVAFVAEFSRGKSELINAIFFADFGARLLPSSAGRTTMCPTELLYDPNEPPSIRLLPIETRARDAAVSEFKNYADEWVSLALDLAQADKMSQALGEVSRVKRVSVADAKRYGLYGEGTSESAWAGTISIDGERMVEVPCWRHAVINFPHPLLKQGLVILDTPGLNAIGTEPELTLNLLPNAHAILFVLAADAGVTKTDIELWQNHLVTDDRASRNGRLVILNKIDGLWDELKTGAAIDDEISRIAQTSASLLRIPLDAVFPVSAQKALVAKVSGDDLLLAKSRLPALERALTRELIPAKRDIVGAATQSELSAIVAHVRSILDARSRGIADELRELRALRGKNDEVITHMMERVKHEKELFDRGLQRFTALRTIFTQMTNRLFTTIGLEVLRANAARTRERIEKSPFTKGIRAAMTEFFCDIGDGFDASARETVEIHELMQGMYRQFAKEHGLEVFQPSSFSMLKYSKEIERLERAYNTHFNTLWNMVSKDKFTLQRRFFETIASRVKHVYNIANRDLEAWLKALMSPLETQVREHQLQLRRRLDSIRRIHRAKDELEERIAELQETVETMREELATVEHEVGDITRLIEAPEALPIAANG